MCSLLLTLSVLGPEPCGRWLEAGPGSFAACLPSAGPGADLRSTPFPLPRASQLDSQGSSTQLSGSQQAIGKVRDGSGPHLGFLFPDHLGCTRASFPSVFSSCATAHPIPLPPLLRAWRLVLEEVRGLALAGRDQVPMGAAAILARHPAAPPPISGLLGGTCRGCSTSAPLFKYNAPIFLVLKAVGLPLHLQCVETNSPPSHPRSSVMG